MSRTATRQAIADALSGVAGIHGHPRRPDSLNEGDGWPQWRSADRADGYAYLNTWAILIVLPADIPSADAFADAHADALDDALRPVLYVESFQPATINAGGEGEINALLITGRSE